VLAFGGELDEGPLVEVSDFDALGYIAALLEQPGETLSALDPADYPSPPSRPAPVRNLRAMAGRSVRSPAATQSQDSQDSEHGKAN